MRQTGAPSQTPSGPCPVPKGSSAPPSHRFRQSRSDPLQKSVSVPLPSPLLVRCPWAFSAFGPCALPPLGCKLGWPATSITRVGSIARYVSSFPIAFLHLPVRELVTVHRLLQFKQHVFPP